MHRCLDMGTVKKRVLRKGASNAEKIDDSVTKKSLHLPPGALQEILVEKKRKVTSKARVVEDIIGGSKHDQDPPSASLPRRKKSVCCYAASAKTVMDSPPSMSTRSVVDYYWQRLLQRNKVTIMQFRMVGLHLKQGGLFGIVKLKMI